MWWVRENITGPSSSLAYYSFDNNISLINDSIRPPWQFVGNQQVRLTKYSPISGLARTERISNCLLVPSSNLFCKQLYDKNISMMLSAVPINTLTHCGLVTQYGVRDLGQHWFR